MTTILNKLKDLRARQVALIQPLADHSQPNDTRMAYFVAKVLGVKVTHKPMQHSL